MTLLRLTITTTTEVGLVVVDEVEVIPTIEDVVLILMGNRILSQPGCAVGFAIEQGTLPLIAIIGWIIPIKNATHLPSLLPWLLPTIRLLTRPNLLIRAPPIISPTTWRTSLDIRTIKALIRSPLAMAKVWKSWRLVPLLFIHPLLFLNCIIFYMCLTFQQTCCLCISFVKTTIAYLSLMHLDSPYRIRYRGRLFSEEWVAVVSIKKIKISSGLYPFHSFVNPTAKTAFVGVIASADTWHRRLSHPPPSIFQCILSSSSLSLAK